MKSTQIKSDSISSANKPKLRVYCLGPGIGESIVLHLPCGGWGVVDCYQTDEGGTVDFLKQHHVERLKFICFTHPHDDHYHGAHKLLARYTSKIERIWRFPGVTKKHLINLALAARGRAKYMGDDEAGEMAEEYLLLLKGLKKERRFLNDRTYRQLTAPGFALEESLYRIDVLGPGAITLEEFEERLASVIIKKCPLLLGDEGGQFINSISVVLAISFDKAKVVLLGDAQGPEEQLDDKNTTCSVVKIAHHGSHNGKASKILTRPKISSFDHGILTPYSRSSLPKLEMLKRYQVSCTKLIHTCPDSLPPPSRNIDGLINPRVFVQKMSWWAVEVLQTGHVAQIPAAPSVIL